MMSHLLELRSRLLKAVAFLLVTTAILVPFSNRLYAQLAHPLVMRLPKDAHLIATEVASPFTTPLKLTFYLSLFITMPMMLYQLWKFVSPGLLKHERHLARPILLAAPSLFYLGCAFAYFLVLPATFSFLTRATPQGVAMMTDITHYLDFVMMTLMGFGLCFEVPVVMVALVAIGIVDAQKLKNGRRYAAVGAFIIAAIITPPDIASMLLLGCSMCLLYEAGIWAAGKLLAPKRQATVAAV